MSKAFTKESDDAPDEPIVIRRPASLSPGTKNYLTPDGAARLRQELDRLVDHERPRLSLGPTNAESKRQLQILDQRMAHLQQILASAVVISPPTTPDEKVHFGATVTVRERDGQESRYRIVGIDEADFDRGWVSWLSPIGKALLNARLGQRVRFQIPAGEEEWLIVGIAYE